MIVADTSLVFHLFNDTELHDIASRVLEQDAYWVVPTLWQEEYANILSKLARKEKRSLDEVVKHFHYTVSQLKHCEIFVDNEKALKLSVESRISVYDAHFVALAIDFDTLLVTEDKEILKNCPNLSIGMQAFLQLASV